MEVDSPNQSNPYTPGFGEVPRIMAVHGNPVADFERGLDGRSSEHLNVLISGARGMGKTVLLKRMVHVAEAERRWPVIPLFTSSKSCEGEIRTSAAFHLRRLDPDASESRVTSGGTSFMGFGTNTAREVAERYADIPDTWGVLLGRLADLATKQGGGLMIAVDEVQSAQPQQLYELAQRIQWHKGKGSRIAFAAAGPPEGIDNLLDSDGTTFLRRSHRVEVQSLGVEGAVEVLRATAEDGGKEMTEDASRAAGEISQGYPYLIQLIGSYAWEKSKHGNTLTLEHVNTSKTQAVADMIRNIHGPTLRSMSGRKFDYLVAMTEDQGPSNVSDIAERMAVDSNNQSVYRDRLIRQGIIRPYGYGSVEFAMPYMREAVMQRHTGQIGPSGSTTATPTLTLIPKRSQSAKPKK